MHLVERLAAIVVLGLLVPVAAQAQASPAGAKGPHRRIISCHAKHNMQECRHAVEALGCSVHRELSLINAVVVTVPEGEAPTLDGKLSAKAEVQSFEEDKYVKWIKTEELALPRFEFPAIQKMVPAFAPAGRTRPSPRPDGVGPLPWGISRVNAPAAWKTTMGAGVKVAVIDTGIDYNHPALAANVKGGFNALDEKNPDDFMDDQGHGSHVSGIIAAAYGGGSGAGGSGVVGVAPKASLYGVKVLDAEGGGNYSTIIAGLAWAVQNKMQVANMSLGAPEETAALRRAVIAAKKAGLVIMAAAGNDSGGPVSYPAAYPETIAISASNSKDGFASFSSKGPEVNFIAPGQDILSVKLGGGFVKLSGTSMATPHMTGLAALTISAGARGFSGVKNALANAASPLPGLSGDEQGYGLVDAAKLVR